MSKTTLVTVIWKHCMRIFLERIPARMGLSKEGKPRQTPPLISRDYELCYLVYDKDM